MYFFDIGPSKVLFLVVETNIERQSLLMLITEADQLQSEPVSCYYIANSLCYKLIKALEKNFLVKTLHIGPKYSIGTNKLQNEDTSS